MLRWPNPTSPSLTGRQLLAVEDRADAIIITGNSGTDLTRVLCAKGLRHIHEGIEPEDVLYLAWSPGVIHGIRQTFEEWVQEGESEERNALTENLRESARLLALNARRSLASQMMTMTEFCVRYLRHEGARLLEISPHFSILTRGQQLQTVSSLAAQDPDLRGLTSPELSEFLQWYHRKATATNYLEAGYDHDDLLRNWLLTEIAANGHELWEIPQPPPVEAWLQLDELYREEKREQGLLDCDEIVQIAARARHQAITRELDSADYGLHLLVDEAEDMTPAALEVIANEKVYFNSVTLAYNTNLCVGAWRGADLGSFMAFIRQYDQPLRHHLPGVEKSSGRLSDFLDRMTQSPVLEGLEAKEHRTYRLRGEVPRLRVCHDRRHLIQSLLESVQDFQESGQDPHQLGLLFRWPTTLEQFSESLDEAGIAYYVLGRPRQALVQDTRRMMGLFTLLYNPHDLAALSDAAMVWAPTGWTEFNISHAEAVEAISEQQGCDLIEAARVHLQTLTRHSAVRRALGNVVNGLDGLRTIREEDAADHVLFDLCAQAFWAVMEEGHPVPACGDQVIRWGQYGTAFHRNQGESAEAYLRRFLDSIAIYGIPDIQQDGIALSAIRDSKGRHWTEAWVVEAGDLLMPQPQDVQLSPLPLWEEQRQLYAAATRAEDRLTFFNLRGGDLELLWAQLTG